MKIPSAFKLSNGIQIPKNLQDKVFPKAMRMTSGHCRGHWVPYKPQLMDRAYEEVLADLARKAAVPTNSPWGLADGRIVLKDDQDAVARLAIADGLPEDFNRRPWILVGLWERVRIKSHRLAKSQERLRKWCERAVRTNEFDCIHSILIYVDAGAVWVDIPELGVYREQMVCGADTLYHELTKGHNRPFGWELRFSAAPFSGTQVELVWRSQTEIGWDRYWCDVFGQMVDLCPVLRLVYPSAPPKLIYVAIKKI